MGNTIKPKRSYTANSVPLTTDLEQNELAINWADGKAFTKNASGQIVSVTLGGSGGSSSSEDTALRAFFLPTAPTNVVATAGNGQASVSWTASTTIAQIPVTDYVVQYSSNSGSTWTTFSDGTSTSTSATVTGLTNGTAYTFRVAGVNGVGTGAYSTASSAVTPSAATDPFFSSVALLLHMDGSGNTFVDSSGSPKTVTANGDATQSAAQSKWGGKSGYFDGSGDYLTFGSANLSFAQGDFAIEMWIYPTATQTSFLADWRLGGSSGPAFYLVNNVMNFYDGGPLNLAASSTVSSNTWTHVAAARSGGTLRLYQDGSLVGTMSMGTDMTGSGSLSIAFHNGVFFTGYIDDLRITIGSARGYTGSTITVPTAPFPDA